MKTILENLQETNTWWATGKTEKEFDYRREELSGIIELLVDKRSTVVAGPRQVGKSTMLRGFIFEFYLSFVISEMAASNPAPACCLLLPCALISTSVLVA